MAAYIVAQLDVKNTNWQKEYGPKAGALVQKHGGKILAGAGSAMERLEGSVHCPASFFFWSSRLWSRPKPGTTILSMFT